MHVTGGVIYLTVILIHGLRGRYTAEFNHEVEIVGLYWHFVDLIWIYGFHLHLSNIGGHENGTGRTQRASKIHEYFWWLLALTIIEVAVAIPDYVAILKGILLIGLACSKAILVANYFMHLKFEKKRWRLS